MLKVVNIKNYRFGKNADEYYWGFAILDTDTGEFLGYPGFGRPYVLTTKKFMQSCIDAHWETMLTERIPYTKKLA